MSRYFMFYRIWREISEGGMGSTYEASHKDDLASRICLKLLKASWYEDRREGALRSMEHEAEVGAKLTHQNIPRFLGCGSDEKTGACFLVFELVRGATLSELEAHLRPEGLSTAQAVYIAWRIASALGHAHDQAVLHRDLKPSNVLIRTDGHPFLVDFGVSRLMSSDNTFSVGVGSQNFMSPEQIEGVALTEQSDLFALGILFYKMVTGRHPFEGDDATATAKNILECKLPEWDAAVSADVRAILEMLLARRAADRFRTAHAVAAALEEALSAIEAPDIAGLGRLASEIQERRASPFQDEYDSSDGEGFTDDGEAPPPSAPNPHEATTKRPDDVPTKRDEQFEAPTVQHNPPPDAATLPAGYRSETVAADAQELAIAAAAALPDGDDRAGSLNDLHRLARTPSDLQSPPASTPMSEAAPEEAAPRDRRVLRGFTERPGSEGTKTAEATAAQQSSSRSTPTAHPSVKRWRHRWAVSAVVLLAVVGVFAWQPWHASNGEGADAPDVAARAAAPELDVAMPSAAAMPEGPVQVPDTEAPSPKRTQTPEPEAAAQAALTQADAGAPSEQPQTASTARESRPTEARSREGQAARRKKGTKRSRRPRVSRSPVDGYRKLVVGVIPWANVSVNGVPLGISPITVWVEPGTHTVVVDDGDMRSKRRVQVDADNDRRVVIDLMEDQ